MRFLRMKDGVNDEDRENRETRESERKRERHTHTNRETGRHKIERGEERHRERKM